MRTISPGQRQALEDLSAQGLLGGLPVQVAEKDIHVTDLLDGLSRLTVSHGHFKCLARGEAARRDDGIQDAEEFADRDSQFEGNPPTALTEQAAQALIERL